MPTALKFDANLSWLFTELPFQERFDAAAAAGFTGVEYASPYQYEPARLRRWLSDAGLKQVLVNTPMGPPESPTGRGLACLPQVVDQFRDGVRRGLDYAAELGAEFLHIVGGIVPDDVSRDRAFARYVMNIAWAAEQVAGTDVRLLLEAQNKRDAPNFILDSQAHAAAVVEAVGSPQVGILMDFFHAQLTDGDLVNTFRTHRELIFHLQVADPPARNEPGTGEINWHTVFAAVRDSGYQGWIGCEYRPASQTVAGLGWLPEWTT